MSADLCVKTDTVPQTARFASCHSVPAVRSVEASAAPRATSWALEPPPRSAIVLRHPAECEPRRQPRPPKWLPSKSDIAARREAAAARSGEWVAPEIVAARDAGAVRIGMTWRKSFVTSTTFCRRSGRTQYFEGPHEIASFRLLSICHSNTDLQFQPLVVRWLRSGRPPREYYVDSVAETAAGRLVFRENKAHRDYFDDPEIAEKVDAAEKALTAHPLVDFEREVGTDLMEPLRWRIVKDIFDDRTVDFGERERDRVGDLFAALGEVPLGRIREAIGGPVEDAARISNAMLCARVIGHRVDRVPVADTRVVRPAAPARPGLLRTFLRGFAPGAEETLQ